MSTPEKNTQSVPRKTQTITRGKTQTVTHGKTQVVRQTSQVKREDTKPTSATLKPDEVQPPPATGADPDTRMTRGNPKSPQTIMRVNLSPLVRRELVVTVKGETKEAAIRELCDAVEAAIELPGTNAAEIAKEILSGEERVNTQMGPNWATPHARLPMLNVPLTMVIGRSPKGVMWSVDRPAVNLIVLLLARDDASEHYLHTLASIVSALRHEDRVAQVLRASNHRGIRSAFTGKPLERRTVNRDLPRVTQRLIRHMLRFADDVDVGSVFLNIDAFEPPEVLSTIIDERTILVTAQREPPESLAVRAGGVISLPFAANNVAAMLRLAIVLAIGKRIISRKARVLALAGPVGSNTLDQMRLFNAKDFPTLDLDEHHSHAIQPGVLERVIEVASTIAREGREGEAVGTLFVIGDEGTLANYTRQLVINPFHGYPRSQLNILDVTLEETIKEFASIDGAFIVASDGAMLSAGTYLSPPQTADVELPSGLGTRHRSAAMLTLAVPCVAVVVSESTRTVSVFYGGKLALALDVGKAGAQSEAQ